MPIRITTAPPKQGEPPPCDDGLRPDGLLAHRVVEVRRNILEEVDGPMLRWGLQALHGGRLHAPRSAGLRPRREFLEERYAWFRKAG